jgi:chitin disaccharide deacetylase
VKKLIVTADDFGAALTINEAIEQGHRRGLLSAASLMVAGGAADDAMARARKLPRLGVGLHLVLVDGKPILPPEQVSHLVNGAGLFPDDLVGLGTRLFFLPVARREAAAEIRAQLDAFRRTGLPLDHVNAHRHFHFHPVVRDVLVRLAPEYRIRAIRLPREPMLASWRATGDRLGTRAWNRLGLDWFVARLGRRLDLAGIAHNDWQLGLSDSGGMNPTRVRRLLAALPDGVSELYVHPAMGKWSGWPTSYDGRAEYEALVDPENLDLIRRQGIEPISFAAL